MANHHFGELGDVWKHLPLAELLVLDPPRHYWETHAGTESYLLEPSPTRRHGALRFLAHAPADPDLADCAYLKLLTSMPGRYPGSGAVAFTLLGSETRYLLCDLDPESVRSLRAASVGLDARICETDGVAAIAAEAERRAVDPARVLVLIDPFDPHARASPDAPTPLELAADLARAGYRVCYWYGYDSLAQRGWAHAVLARAVPRTRLWCGDIVFPAAHVYPDRAGAWGCGIVLANASEAAGAACDRLGRALERISRDNRARGNRPERLSFEALS